MGKMTPGALSYSKRLRKPVTGKAFMKIYAYQVIVMKIRFLLGLKFFKAFQM